MNIDVLVWLFGQVVIAAAVFGGIRMDLKNIHRSIAKLDNDVNDAHKRIDGILLNKKL